MTEPAPSSGTLSPAHTGRALPLLIIGQLALHSGMAGQRMAAPLQALSAGFNPWAVGVLLALFAALPVITAMPAGRMADRLGYHRPVRLAVAFGIAGSACAVGACWLSGWWQFGLHCAGAALSGVGTNLSLIVSQRTAGQLVASGADRLRVFSWMGMAPSLANVVGPVTAGLLIDAGGFAAAYGFLMVLPAVTLLVSRRVPPANLVPQLARAPGQSRWDLLDAPGFKRLLFVNWLLSASWDVHSFAVPVLGHSRGYSASTIGFVLGIFTAAVTLVRFLIPLLAHRLSEVSVLFTAMVLTGIVFTIYPFAATPWLMGVCAALLGLTLGAVQPMIMSTLHHLTPAHRHGEAIAFRSMAINFSSSLMPLTFGLVGTALGPGALFWMMGAAVGCGSLAARGLRKVFESESQADGEGPAA